MLLIHKGFDALDIAYCAHIPLKHVSKVQEAKEKAASIRGGSKTKRATSCANLDGQLFNVAGSGVSGGYAFLCDTGSLGENWFFKKPNPKDPWGIRVSVSAIQVALCGLAGVRERLENTLRALGIVVDEGMESISRVDFAMDFHYPEFELNPTNFIMHPRCNRKSYGEFQEYRENAAGNRVQSVTIGKNPGRQIIVYDKRAEVLANSKAFWPVVWDKYRKDHGLPRIDLSDPETSRIWRIELRAYKNHLKNDWNVSTWGTLQKNLPSILRNMMEDIRYIEPSADTNRSRWSNHLLWDTAKQEIEDELMTLRSFASEDHIRELLKHERDEMIRAQINGCLITRAGLNEVRYDELSAFVLQSVEETLSDFKRNEERTIQKLEKATERYL